MSTPRPRELLDVEDEHAREQRIQSLLESTDATSAPVSIPRPPSANKPHPLPLSAVISRAKDFLPRLAASNAELAQTAAADPASVDIEHLGPAGDDQPHIEMNLGLGVFEQRPRGAAKPAPTAPSSSPPPRASTAPPTLHDAAPSASSSSSSSDTNSTDDDDSDDSDASSVISTLPAEEARAIEALLSPRPLALSFQQQQQQQQEHQPPGGSAQRARRPPEISLASPLDSDVDMNTPGPQTAKGWAEE